MAQRRLPTRVPCTELAFIVERYTVTICETPVDSKACPQHPLIILSSIFQPNLTSPLFADFFFDGSRSRNFHIKIATYVDAADSLAKYVDSCEFTQESEQHDTAFRIHRLSVVEKRELCRVGLGLVAATIHPNLLKVGFDSGSNWNDNLNCRDLFQPKLLQGSYDIRSMRLRRAFRTFAEPFISVRILISSEIVKASFNSQRKEKDAVLGTCSNFMIFVGSVI